MWNLLKEKTPKELQVVLAYELTGQMAVARYTNGIFKGRAFGFDAYESTGAKNYPITGLVTHWMPLPEAPPYNAIVD